MAANANPCIYKIENILNGKIYIGQTINASKRWKAHKDHSKEKYIKTHKNNVLPIDIDISKYGLENFKFTVIEYCLKNQLNSRESFWISHYNSIENGYNRSKGVNFGMGRKDLCGKKFEKITVIKDADDSIFCGKRVRNLYCLCDCGNTFTATYSSIISGKTKSCGCFSREIHSKKIKNNSQLNDAFKQKYDSPEKRAALHIGRKISSNNKSGYKGISWDNQRKRWQVHLCYMGKNKRIGSYIDLQDAISARKRAESEIYPNTKEDNKNG